MNCKNCNAELAKDAVYCPQCGKRVDGKRRCTHCGRDIDENSLYCTYCGARVDGKTICPKCGEAYNGSFCPKCGTPAHLTATPSPKAATADKKGAMRVLTVTKQSVLYGALCVLFVFSFFITFSLIATANLISVRTDINSTSFYFLITQFQEISDFLAEGSYYPELSVALYLDAGISAACVAAIIIICTTYFIIGTVVFTKSIKSKNEVAMSKYVITPALLTLILILFMFSFVSASISQNKNQAEIALGTTTIVNIVLVSVALFSAAILHIIIDAKEQKNNILNYILNAVGLLIAFLILVTLPKNLFSLNGRTTETTFSGGTSAPLLFIGILAMMGTIDNATDLEAMSGILTNSAVIFALFILTFAAAAVAAIAFAKGILNKSSARHRILSCVFSAFSTGLSIAYLTMSIILCSQNLAGAAMIGASPICALIFSVLALALSIVNCCILRNKEKPELTYTASPDYPIQPTE